MSVDYLECEHCGKKSEDVKWRKDLFLWGVHDEIVYVCLCDDCSDDQVWDI